MSRGGDEDSTAMIEIPIENDDENKVSDDIEDPKSTTSKPKSSYY